MYHRKVQDTEIKPSLNYIFNMFTSRISVMLLLTLAEKWSKSKNWFHFQNVWREEQYCIKEIQSTTGSKYVVGVYGEQGWKRKVESVIKQDK